MVILYLKAAVYYQVVPQQHRALTSSVQWATLFLEVDYTPGKSGISS